MPWRRDVLLVARATGDYGHSRPARTGDELARAACSSRASPLLPSTTLSHYTLCEPRFGHQATRASYFRSTVDSIKTRSLVKQICEMDVTVVHSEAEAFILENNYIKKYKPRYNVLLRDDKSYPFIFLSDHTHPRLSNHRGPKKLKGEYFGQI